MYGLSMPQVYAEFFAPVHYGLSAKFGHFYSPMGFESAMAPANFFYSRSYSMMYCEPTTFTGMLLSQRLTPNLTGHFGLTQGWDAWESPSDKLSYLAGVQWTSWSRRTDISFLVHTGKTPSMVAGFDNIRVSNVENTRTNYSLVLAHRILPSLKYVIQHDYGFEDNATSDIIFSDGQIVERYLNGQWASINQELFYQATETIAFGGRFEWMRDGNHSRILRRSQLFDSRIEGDNYYSLTLGMNWKPSSFMTLRPECRWDWSDVKIVNGYGDARVESPIFNDFTKSNALTIGVDLILTF